MPTESTRRTFLGLLASLAAGGVVTACAPAESGARPARPGGGPTVGAFLGSVGMNTHWDYPDTPYGTAAGELIDRLGQLRVGTTRTATTQRCEELFARGIRSLLILEPGPADDLEQTLDRIEPLARSGAIEAIQSANEPDTFWSEQGRTFRGRGFPEGVVAWQRALSRAVRARSAFASVRLVGPSLGKTYWGSPNPLGTAGELAADVDVGAFHPYPGGNSFSDTFDLNGIPRYYWNTDFPSIALDRYPVNLASARGPFGGRPLWATETGYSTWKAGPTEEVQAAYTVRLVLENFRLGIGRTYLYELIDEFVDPTGEDRQAHFGLLRRDLSPKPAFVALAALMEAMAGAVDGEPTGRELDLTVVPRTTDPESAAAVHSLVLDAGRGHVAAVWHEVGLDDYSAGTDRAPRRVSWPVVETFVDYPRQLGGVMRQMRPDGTFSAPVELRAGGESVPVSEWPMLITLT